MEKKQKKISKGFEQKLASFGLKTPFKIQMGSQITRLRAIGKLNIARQRAIAQQTPVQWSQAIAQANLSRAKGKILAKNSKLTKAEKG